MYRYTIKVKLGNSLLNEVIKDDVSPAEVTILRRKHSAEAVEILSETKVDAYPANEREELKMRHCSNKEGRTRFSFMDFERIFGSDGEDLPTRLPEFIKKEVFPAAQAKNNNRLKELTE